MLPILAFDLSWSGPTGWVLYDDDALPVHRPLVKYGEFEPGRTNTDIVLFECILDAINECVLPGKSVIAVAEITDWHRNLKGLKGKQFDIQYKIERQAQFTLGSAKASFNLACNISPVVVRAVLIGANEAKREFGAMRKDACASLLVEEYPGRFERHDKKNSFLYDKLFKCDISDHISDAMVIASVVAKREHQASLIKAQS